MNEFGLGEAYRDSSVQENGSGLGVLTPESIDAAIERLAPRQRLLLKALQEKLDAHEGPFIVRLDNPQVAELLDRLPF